MQTVAPDVKYRTVIRDHVMMFFLPYFGHPFFLRLVPRDSSLIA